MLLFPLTLCGAQWPECWKVEGNCEELYVVQVCEKAASLGWHAAISASSKFIYPNMSKQLSPDNIIDTG